MSDTPETDAAMLLEREGITHPELHETYMAWTDYWALGQHARSLERRLREAHDMCDRYAEQLQDALREVEELREALTHSVELQSHYAELLNMHDGGERMMFTAKTWLARLAALAEKGKP